MEFYHGRKWSVHEVSKKKRNTVGLFWPQPFVLPNCDVLPGSESREFLGGTEENRVSLTSGHIFTSFYLFGLMIFDCLRPSLSVKALWYYLYLSEWRQIRDIIWFAVAVLMKRVSRGGINFWMHAFFLLGDDILISHLSIGTIKCRPIHLTSIMGFSCSFAWCEWSLLSWVLATNIWNKLSHTKRA